MRNMVQLGKRPYGKDLLAGRLCQNSENQSFLHKRMGGISLWRKSLLSGRFSDEGKTDIQEE